jgi:hypothetical protein
LFSFHLFLPSLDPSEADFFPQDDPDPTALIGHEQVAPRIRPQPQPYTHARKAIGG